MKPNRVVFSTRTRQYNSCAALPRSLPKKTTSGRKADDEKTNRQTKKQPEFDGLTYIPEKRLDIVKRRGAKGRVQQTDGLQTGLQPCHGILCRQKIGVQNGWSRAERHVLATGFTLYVYS